MCSGQLLSMVVGVDLEGRFDEVAHAGPRRRRYAVEEPPPAHTTPRPPEDEVSFSEGGCTGLRSRVHCYLRGVARARASAFAWQGPPPTLLLLFQTGTAGSASKEQRQSR